MTEYRVAEVTGPERLRLAERRGGDPGPRDVVARVHAAGICGTDVGIYDGTLAYFESGLMHFPVVPGHEWSGVVAAVGDEVTRVRVGDRMTAECHIGCGACALCRQGRNNLCPTRARVGLIGLEGAMGERVTVPEKAVHRLPPDFDLDTAALIEPATVAFRAVEKLGQLAGKRAVVLGAGPIGLLAALFLRVGGVGWLAVADREAGRLETAATLGVDATVDAAEGDVAAVVRAETDGDGADLVVEATGASGVVATAVEVAGLGASVVLVSQYKERPVTLVADRIVTKDLTLYGMMGSPGVWERTIRLMTTGRVDPRPLISHRFPLAAAREAFEVARGRGAGVLKVLLTPTA